MQYGIQLLAQPHKNTKHQSAVKGTPELKLMHKNTSTKVLSVSKNCTCILESKMGKYSSLWIDAFKGGESTWKTSIKQKTSSLTV